MLTRLCDRDRERLKSLAALAVLVGVCAAFFASFLDGQRIVAERDALSAVLPDKRLLALSLARGELPWWNPAPALGKPFFADPLAGALYPGNLLLLLPPFARGYGAFIAGQYAWTAIGAFLCLRVVGLPRLAALVGALVWGLGGATLSLANVANHLAAVAWLPWALYGWSRPRQAPARMACAALGLLPTFLAGSPEMAAIACAALVVWAWDWRSLAAPVLAAALAGAQLVPVLAYAVETARAARGFDVESAMRLSAPPAQLAQLVYDGGALDPTPFLRSVFVGPVALGLALLALATVPRRRAILLVACGVLSALVALGPHARLLPIAVRLLPLAGLVRYPGKALVALHALIAFGAAFGFARVLQAVARRGGQSVATAAGGALALAAVLPLVVAGRAILAGEPSETVLSPPAVARAMLADARAESRAPNAPADASPAPEAQESALASGGLRYYSNANGIPPASSASQAVRLDRALLYAATGELYGLANVNTPSSLNLVTHDFLAAALQSASRDGALGALAALGTRYATTWVPFEGSSIARRVEFAGGDGDPQALLYRLDGAAPRAFLARRIAVAADLLAATGRFALARPGTHAGLAVVEQDDVPVLQEKLGADLSAASPGESTAAAEVEWRVDRPAELALEVALDRPGLLVVNDSWARGWTASVDGVPQSIVRVNGVVRGIALGRGRHRVAMRYRPPGLRDGVLLSAAAGLVVVLLLLAARRRGRPA